jgi:hypothetical protein
VVRKGWEHQVYYLLLYEDGDLNSRTNMFYSSEKGWGMKNYCGEFHQREKRAGVC